MSLIDQFTVRPIDAVTPYRLILLAGVTLLAAGCARHKLADFVDDTGGQRITRSTCPAVAVPAYTGDVTLFSPEQSRDARAQDVSATITNLQIACDESGATVHSKVTFDVVAQRASATGDRDVVLPYFSTVIRAGTQIQSKQIGQVQVHFANGQVRGSGRAGASADVLKSLASLPPAVSGRLNRKRKAGDADAAVDPMNDPAIRGAVNKANFELLIGFQLTEAQLAYNATR